MHMTSTKGATATSEALVTHSPAKTRPLIQVCPSIHRKCGVGNYAKYLLSAMQSSGAAISTVEQVPVNSDADLLVQHEFGLLDTAQLRKALQQHRGRVFLFAHSRDADRHFSDLVAAYITFCEGMTASGTRQLVLPHPGWQRVPLLDRAALKSHLGWTKYRGVIGTNGFIRPSRRYDEIARQLIGFARRENILLRVICPRHHTHDDRPGYRDQEFRLQALAQEYPQHLQLETQFLDHDELNRRFQACDLTWGWTKTPSSPYGSGTSSDQYGSGTRMIVADKLQLKHVLQLPHTMAVIGNAEEFVGILKRESLARVSSARSLSAFMVNFRWAASTVHCRRRSRGAESCEH